jgi:hypothetical protein
MRQADIHDSGQSNIPVRDTYGGYPRSENSGQQDQNATPGPSRPRRADQDIHHRQISDHESSRSRTHDKHSRPSSRDKIGRQGKDPSDPNDSESSDSMYKDCTRSTTTETETTSSSSEEGSDRQDSRSRRGWNRC